MSVPSLRQYLTSLKFFNSSYVGGFPSRIATSSLNSAHRAGCCASSQNRFPNTLAVVSYIADTKLVSCNQCCFSTSFKSQYATPCGVSITKDFCTRGSYIPFQPAKH